MKRARSGITRGFAVAALAAGVAPASASQLNLLPILQISGQHSDNVFFAPDSAKQSDTFWLVNPGVALDYASHNFVGSLAYQLGLQRHSDFKERDNDVHRLDAQAGFNLSKGFYFDATDNYFMTTDPLAFDASGDRVQRDSFDYNRFVPSFSYHFGSSRDVRFGARYDRIDIDYDTLTDSYQNGYGASLSAKMGARSTFNVDYFQFDRHFSNQDVRFNTVDYRGRRYSARVDRRFSPRLSSNLMVGYEERRFEQDPGRLNFESWIAELSLTGEVANAFSWTVSGSQRLNDLAVVGAYKIRRGNLELRKSIAERLRIEASGFLQNSNNRQIPEEADFKGAKLEGQYLVAKFLNVWLGYEYLNRDKTTGTLTPFTENRINFGLSLSYGL